MNIIFLGTGSIATKTRNSQGILVEGEDSTLIDCGEGIQRQLLHLDYDVKKIKRICITHSHVDHIIGIIGVVCLIGKQRSTVEIIGSDVVINNCKNLINLYAPNFSNFVTYYVMTPDETYGNLTTFETYHTTDSLGFIINKPYKLTFGGDLDIDKNNQMDALAKVYEGSDFSVIDGVHITIEQAAGLMKKAGLKRAYILPIPLWEDDLTLQGKGIAERVNFSIPKDFQIVRLEK